MMIDKLVLSLIDSFFENNLRNRIMCDIPKFPGTALGCIHERIGGITTYLDDISKECEVILPLPEIHYAKTDNGLRDMPLAKYISELNSFNEILKIVDREAAEIQKSISDSTREEYKDISHIIRGMEKKKIKFDCDTAEEFILRNANNPHFRDMHTVNNKICPGIAEQVFDAQKKYETKLRIDAEFISDVERTRRALQSVNSQICELVKDMNTVRDIVLNNRLDSPSCSVIENTVIQLLSGNITRSRARKSLSDRKEFESAVVNRAISAESVDSTVQNTYTPKYYDKEELAFLESRRIKTSFAKYLLDRKNYFTTKKFMTFLERIFKECDVDEKEVSIIYQNTPVLLTESDCSMQKYLALVQALVSVYNPRVVSGVLPRNNPMIQFKRSSGKIYP